MKHVAKTGCDWRWLSITSKIVVICRWSNCGRRLDPVWSRRGSRDGRGVSLCDETNDGESLVTDSRHDRCALFRNLNLTRIISLANSGIFFRPKVAGPVQVLRLTLTKICQDSRVDPVPPVPQEKDWDGPGNASTDWQSHSGTVPMGCPCNRRLSSTCSSAVFGLRCLASSSARSKPTSAIRCRETSFSLSYSRLREPVGLSH